MALRRNHYDAAFEAWLRERRQPYVSVDETRRALLRDASLKSMDFIVYSQRGRNLLVDVKGRQFPAAGQAGRRWENWATAEDIGSLLTWQRVFGGDFRAVLVFTYDLGQNANAADLHQQRLEFRERSYSFYGVWVDEYQRQMRQRSASWQTVSLRTAEFRRLLQPVERLM